MYFNKRKSQRKLVLQKKRKATLTFFDPTRLMFLTSFFKHYKFIGATQTAYIELRFVRYIARKFRRRTRRRKYKGFIFFCCNHAWFKKSKNARMGKGKGRFVRYTYLSKPLKPIFILSQLSTFRVSKFIRYINNFGKYFFLFSQKHRL